MHKAQHSKLICNEKQIKNEHRIYKEWREEIFFFIFFKIYTVFGNPETEEEEEKRLEI